MNAKIISETDAPLMSRKRLDFEINYSGSRTPSKEEVRKAIAAAQKVKEELVVVKHIYPAFGSSKAKVIAHVYNALQDVQKFEPKKKEKKAETVAEKPKEKKGGK